MSMKWIMVLLMTFFSLLSGMHEETSLNDQECLSVLKRLLLNQSVTLSRSKQIVFCKKSYAIQAINQAKGSLSVDLHSCHDCRAITLKGAGMLLPNGDIALYIKEILVSQNKE